MPHEGLPPIDKEKLRKPHIVLEFGANGHEEEYVIIYRPDGFYTMGEDIPGDWEWEFKNALGKGWNVMNRGTRLEIKPPQVGENKFTAPRIRNAETDTAIAATFKTLVGEDVILVFTPPISKK